MYIISRLASVCACALVALLSTRAAAAPSEQARLARIEAIFQPFQTDRAALAPDGRHLAYELRRDGRLFLVIVDLTKNHAVELPLIEDQPIPLSGVSEKVPARLTDLLWPSADRLLAVVQDELVIGVDPDGRNFKQLADSRTLAFFTEPARESGLSFKPPSRQMELYDVSDPAFSNPELQALRRRARAEGEGFFEFPDADTASSAVSTHTDLGNPMGSELFNSQSGAGVVPSNRVRLHLLPEQPGEVLLEIRGRAGPWDDASTLEEEPAVNAFDIVSALARINTRTGKRLWWSGDFATSRLLADRQGQLRLKLKHFRTERSFLVAPKPGARFQKLENLSQGAETPKFDFRALDFFSPRAIPLGFGHEPNLLYYASNVGRNTFGIYALDLNTGQPTDFAVEHDQYDLVDVNEAIPSDTLVFDRHAHELVGIRFESLRRETLWFDPELQALQKELAAMAPDTDFELVEWNADRSRFLILGSSQSDPGAYYIYDRAASQLGEYVRRAPAVTPELTSTTTPFVTPLASGGRLHGYFTYPRERRIEPVPLLVYCHDGPWSRDRAGYDRGAQALASMGFAVLQVNYRGSSGFGRAHLDAMREGGDRVALDDIIAALDAVQAAHGVAKKRVAILGNGYGGTLALRALQEHPDRFRCAVSINAPTNLPIWMQQPPQAISFAREVRQAFFGSDFDKLVAASPTAAPAAFTRPVLIIHAESDTVVPESHARRLRRALDGKAPIDPEYLKLPYEGHARWLPGSYVKVFNRLEQFFNTNIFEFEAEAGEATVVDE